MSYPYLPVNPCCTEVVLNTPCGCSSTITNGGCENPCGTNLTASSTILYDGPALSCTTAEPCDTLNVILQKIDEIICNLLTQINILTIQINNMTTQIINIEGDIINIYDQLSDCCNATTTTTSTAAPIICESFSLTNTGVDPVAIIITDCVTQQPEAIVLMPGDTNICVVTDSPLTVPGTVIVVPNGPCGTTTTTTTLVPTTTTTTTSYACECLTFYNEDVDIHVISYTDCNGNVSEPINIASHETIQVCGCCGFASDEFVTITIGANCVNGECPVPTTTTTTTSVPPTTTTTTTIVETCNCVEITISQADLDDATGNTFPIPDNYVLLNNAVKGSACEGGDLPGGWDTAGVYNYCIKSGDIDQLTVSYWKDDVSISVTESQIVNLETSCFIDGQCVPSTTTTTTTLCQDCIAYAFPNPNDGNGTGTINGITVTTTYTGPSINSPGPRNNYNNCAGFPMDADTLYIAQLTGAFTLTISFSSPVNDVYISNSAMGYNLFPGQQECFTVDSDQGTPTLSLVGGCYDYGPVGNQICGSWQGGNTGGSVQVSTSTPYTELTITGVGISNLVGYGFDICFPSCNTTTTTSSSTSTTTTTTVEPTTTTTTTSEPTTTTTTTCNPATPHPFNITVVNGTSTVPDSGSFLVDACAAIECLQAASCTVTSSFSVYFDVESPGIGDTVYAGSTGCTLGLVGYDGYFQINYGGIWTVVQIINSVIVDFPTCTTTTTTTTALCGNFSFQGLVGGGSWTGLDCYTGLAVGNSIAEGDTQTTGCIISSSLSYTNLETKGDAPCDPTTTTTTTVAPA